MPTSDPTARPPGAGQIEPDVAPTTAPSPQTTRTAAPAAPAAPAVRPNPTVPVSPKRPPATNQMTSAPPGADRTPAGVEVTPPAASASNTMSPALRHRAAALDVPPSIEGSTVPAADTSSDGGAEAAGDGPGIRPTGRTGGQAAAPPIELGAEVVLGDQRDAPRPLGVTGAGRGVDASASHRLADGAAAAEQLRRADVQRLAGFTKVGVDVATDGLGHVRIEASGHAGDLQMNLTADDAGARAALGERLPELREQLRASGLDVTSLDVSTGGDARRGRDDEGGTRPEPAAAAPGEQLDTPPTATTTGAPRPNDGRVDLRL